MKISTLAASLVKTRGLIDIKLQRLSPIFTSYKFQQTSAEVNEEKEVVVGEKIELKRPEVKKWKRPPFVKNLFIGKFDTELLSFPEVLDDVHLKAVENYLWGINDLFSRKVNSAQIEAERKIPHDVLQHMKNMGLFGRMLPEEYGGLGLTFTEYTRLNEAISLDWSVGASLIAHEFLGTQALLLFGSELQKTKYLPDLASGQKIAALCCSETSSGWDPTSVQTTAVYVSSDKTYQLDGTKSWVTNAGIADVYIVLAKLLKHSDLIDDEDDEVCAFLVDKNTKGLQISTYNDTVGLCGSSAGTVELKEVVVPEENLLGVCGTGSFMVNKLREMSRFGIGSLSFGVLKSFLDNITEYAIDVDRNGKSLSYFQLIRKRLSHIVQTIYAMESAAYFTAAIHDTTETPDCSLENTILKVFNSEGTLFCIRELLAILGCFSLTKAQKLEKFFRDAQALALFDNHNDICRLQIGLTGCQYAGNHYADLIKQNRNPFYFPGNHFKGLYRRYRTAHDKFTYEQDIAGHLHPSFVFQGNALEECLQRLQLAVETVLTNHGKDVIETQFDPARLADLAINLYVRTAVLSRSSRSYCIGLKNAHHEMKLACAFCYKAEAQFLKTCKDICMGAIQNCDEQHLSLGGHVVESKGFFPEHPLKHNF